MQQFQSLQRLLAFYTLTLLAMLSLYYFIMFHEMKNHSKQHSVEIFHTLQYQISELNNPINPAVKKIVEKPFLAGISYQLIFIMPSGETYIYHHTEADEREFTSPMLPSIETSLLSNKNSHSTYTLSNDKLIGTIELKSGHKLYTVLRHKPLDINWVSYHYWLPLMTAIMFFTLALLYALKRRANWEQLLLYTDNLSSHAKDAYTPPPFVSNKSTPDFLQLGHALSRISYQLHNNHRRITTLKHRLERLVDHAPLPMLMIMRHGQISFFNQRFEQVFSTAFHDDNNYRLTDFVFSEDQSTQLLLQKLVTLRVTRTLLVYALTNKKAYQLHITPWFGEHGQVHGFTVLLNNVNDLVSQNAQLQQQNLEIQQRLDEFNTLKSSMGHDLRLPLEAMIDTLEPIDTSVLTVKEHQIVNTLIETSQSMLIMLNEMLDIGEIEVRKTRLSIDTVDIYKTGQQVSHLFIKEARQHGLELLYFFAPDCPRLIETDHSRLQQILRNLLDNAIRYTTSGYVALTIETVSAAQLSIAQENGLVNDLVAESTNKKTNPAHDWIRFSIQDSGIGLEASKKDQLLAYFNLNAQLENTITNQPSSKKSERQINTQIMQAGVGLTTARSFAKLLGGFIELHSTPDTGSTFDLYIPCRNPNYQPIYHLNPYLTQIHLIAIINQPLAAEQLKRLCNHLSIVVTFLTSTDNVDLAQLTDNLIQNKQTLAPILLLDYDYYESLTLALSKPLEVASKESTNINTLEQQTAVTDNLLVDKAVGNKASSDKMSSNIDRQHALNHLLANVSLPKILLSMKSERRITSILLDKCDGFLTKPLDANLWLSELLRLTLPTRQTLKQGAEISNHNNSVEITNTHSEAISPLILVVEDSPTNQKIACKILAKLGYRSVVAEDGQRALDILQTQRQEIALILMDCRMPVMDGLQATQAIRALGDDIPIVALTANNTEEDRLSCLQVGMDDFLAKPINKDKLQEVLASLIKI
jgi:CheY-like chemotaxis protein/signal transduction histidine kinase